MHNLLKGVRQVGFDLDKTLYPPQPEIDDRVRTKICERLLQLKPEFETIKRARAYFELEYTALGSGRKVLKKAGMNDYQADRAMDESLATADVLDLIQPNHRLVGILDRIVSKYSLFLITSSPEEIGKKKLERIGIDPIIFSNTMFSDTPGCGYKSSGEPFLKMIERTGEEPRAHVYFGDSKSSDIVPSKGAGMIAIGVGAVIEEANMSIPNISKIEGLLL